MRKPTKAELAEMLNVTEEVFHRDIKPYIKRDFRKELSNIMDKTTNPDIWLDEQDNMILVNPQNVNRYYQTNLSIYSYKEE